MIVIGNRARPALIGELVVSNNLEEVSGSGGLQIAPAATACPGRGFGTEATRLISGHDFGAVCLRRVELEVYRFNPRPRHVYEEAGYV